MLNEYAREQMVSQQVRAWDVLDDEVLEVMRFVPREEFVPADSRTLAFADIDIALPGGHRMLPPKVVGRILQSLALHPGKRVLEVGTGSGFLSACMGRLGAQVRSLEISPELAGFARANLRKTATVGVEVVTGDGLQLIRDAARYDAIALTASMPLYDPRFEQRLEAGGRLFVVVGESAAMDARLITRLPDGGFERVSLFETVIEPLVNAPHAEIFTF
ncbi:MAG: protein-L-isoaspartate O-methyltransferase [Steroidobacteraceae bacterium]